MSTHQIREAMELASDVALLERGQIVFAGPQTPEMLLDPGWLYRTYGDRAGSESGPEPRLAIASKDLRTEIRTKGVAQCQRLVRARDSGALQLCFRSGPRRNLEISGGLLWLV